MFKIFNAYPKGTKKIYCVVRAIVTATIHKIFG